MNTPGPAQPPFSRALVPKGASTPPLDRTEILSARLVLRPVSVDDTDNFFQEFTDEITYFMVPRAPERLEESEHFVRTCQEALADGTDLVVTILDKKNQEFMGCAGLNVRDDPRTPELGIWIKKSAHGKGLGREAITALHNWAIFNFEIDFFIYPVDRANRPSRKIAESLNGEIFMEAEKMTHHGRILDEVIYRIPNVKPVKRGGGLFGIRRFFPLR